VPLRIHELAALDASSCAIPTSSRTTLRELNDQADAAEALTMLHSADMWTLRRDIITVISTIRFEGKWLLHRCVVSDEALNPPA
jgi:hypothetical protein